MNNNAGRLSRIGKLFYRLSFFGIGALVLCGFSIMQKMIVGELLLALNPRAYVVPILYGGITGLVLGEWYLRLKQDALIIQENEERLRTLVNALPDFVIFKDGAGRWQDVNVVGERLFEFQAERYHGQTDLDLAEQVPNLRELMLWCHATDEETWERGELSHCQVGAFAFKGKLHSYDLVKVPLYWPDGRRKGMVIVGRDITDLKESEKQLILAYDSTLNGWAKAIELRDKVTDDHTRRVVAVTEALARLAGVAEEQLVHIRRGAMLHDIGKIGVPDSILSKPGPVSEIEMAVMRQHPEQAFRMLSDIEFLRPALEIPYCHHEHWDGSGYPRGLQGEQIPLAARIFAVVDVWDALTSDRPYRKAWPEQEALEYIQQQAGINFDPRIVKIFVENIAALRVLE